MRSHLQRLEIRPLKEETLLLTDWGIFTKNGPRLERFLVEDDEEDCEMWLKSSEKASKWTFSTDE